ncbi:MAG: N4-gp56 family major capsid protein [Burkholderiaceae bacterium]|nr:N4-gp56 family major capsid protein [Burkholderiaceae bacterium]
MSTQTMLDPQAARIARFKGEILKHAIPQEVLGRVGVSLKKTIPKNMSETVTYRRWLPKGATSAAPNTWSVDPVTHRLNEGETPAAESITAQDISVSLEEYGVLYRYSNRVADMYEDDVPGEMKRLTGERFGLLREMIRYGKLKAGTNKFYTGAATSRATVTALLSANGFRNIARSLSNNLASKVTRVLSASPGVGTQPIEAAYIAVCHSDMEADIRSVLTGFVHVSEYGDRKPMHENELGSWEQFRFVTSPHLAPYLLAGTTATANTRLANGVANSAGSELVDVYPIMVMSEECYGDVMLRGRDSIDVTHIRAGEKTKDDPHGQRGYVGAQGYHAVVRLNEGHMAIYEAACSSL